MLKWGAIAMFGLAVIGLIVFMVLPIDIGRLNYQTSLFTGAPQAENFVRQDSFYPINEMQPAAIPFEFPTGGSLTLPKNFSHGDRVFETDAFLTKTDTGALLVVQQGQLVFEHYALTGGADIPWLTHSLSKSFVATAVGLALDDGQIESLDDPIDHYVKELAASGYTGVSIRDVLQMSSGIRWNEDYADPESDLNQFGTTLFTGDSYDDFVAARVNERPPGQYNRYTGMDAQALTMLVRAVTGASLAQYLQAKLWTPLGMQDRGYWTTDNGGVELGLGGLSATARDLAKLGELYRLGGVWLDQQILSAEWVRAATTVTAPHLARGENPNSEHSMGYGYQWWLPDGDDQDFSGIGIYNQFIYVNPRHSTVIVKLSAYKNYANLEVEDPYLEAETFSLFRKIAKSTQR